MVREDLITPDGRVEDNSAVPSHRRILRRSRRFLPGLAVLALGSFVLFYGLGEKGFWDRAEARSAVAAREMLAAGEFLVPTVNGELFVDNRPPGFYWLVALSFRVVGAQSEFAARLPAALFGLGCVLLAFRFGRGLAGLRGGLLTGLILLGTVKFTFQARSAEQDVVLTFWTLLAAWTFWNALRRPEGSWAWVALFHLSVGLGGLTKGPAVVITAALPAVAWLLVSRRWRARITWQLLLLSPLSIALAAWWYVYILYAGPAEAAQLTARLGLQSTYHVRDSLYYVLKLPALLGLSTTLLPLLFRRWHLASRRQRGVVYCLVWSLVPVLVFSLFPSKQTHYLVPTFPPLAVALGVATRSVRSRKYIRALSTVVAASLVLAVSIWNTAAPESLRIVDLGPSGWFTLILLLLIVSVTVPLLAFLQKSDADFPLAWSAALTVLALALGHVVPLLDDAKSPRRFAEAVQNIVPDGASLATTNAHPGLIFYLRRSVERVPRSQERSYLSSGSSRYLIIESRESKRERVPEGEVLLRYEPYLHRNRAAYLLRSLPSSSR